jgi:hypothetical protein
MSFMNAILTPDSGITWSVSAIVQKLVQGNGSQRLGKSCGIPVIENKEWAIWGVFMGNMCSL